MKGITFLSSLLIFRICRAKKLRKSAIQSTFHGDGATCISRKIVMRRRQSLSLVNTGIGPNNFDMHRKQGRDAYECSQCR